MDLDAERDPIFTTWWQSKSWMDYPTPLEVNITLTWDKAQELRVSDSIVQPIA